VVIVLLTFIEFIFSYVLDPEKSDGWTLVASVLAFITLGLAIFGLISPDSDYVVMLMLNALVFWVASIVRHLTVSEPMTHLRA
jgi:hypothetical protein